MAGLLARDSTSGRLPGLATSDIKPIVLAYSGGSAGESHPSSLSSPCGHLDPIYSFRAMLRICVDIPSGIMVICQGVILRSALARPPHSFPSFIPLIQFSSFIPLIHSPHSPHSPHSHSFPFIPISSQRKSTSYEASLGANPAELVTPRDTLQVKSQQKWHLTSFI